MKQGQVKLSQKLPKNKQEERGKILAWGALAKWHDRAKFLPLLYFMPKARTLAQFVRAT